MSSIVHAAREQLADLGEYVVMANISSGWFAVFENTLDVQAKRAQANGRAGPNLVIYRTRNEAVEARDHYVVPNAVFLSMVTDETVATAKISSSRRWNFTFKDNRLRVTHGNSVDITPYYRAPLLVEPVSPAPKSVPKPQARFQAREALEGLAREYRVAARSRSSALREGALEASLGVCEACGINFVLLLNGVGARALQVHHKKQLSKSEVEVVTSLEDLAVLCANCHCIVHANPKEPMRVEELKALWAKERQ